MGVLGEKMTKKETIVMCILSGQSESCDKNCTMFKKCWSKKK